MEEAYILSAFRRKDDCEWNEWKEADEIEGKPSENETKETKTQVTDATGDLPSVECLRATLQALRVQDRLAFRAEASVDRLAQLAPVERLVPTVPTVPMEGENSQAEVNGVNGVRASLALELANVTAQLETQEMYGSN